MLGSETIEIPVVEYVVFENHIANQYGTWRLHSKIQADVPKRNQLTKTFVMKEKKEKYDVPDQVDKWIDTDEEEKEKEDSEADEKKPVLASWFIARLDFWVWSWFWGQDEPTHVKHVLYAKAIP